MGHSFETSRGSQALLQGDCDHIEVIPKREPAGNCSQSVIDVWWSNQRRMKITRSGRCVKLKVHAGERELRVARRHIGICFQCITNYPQTLTLEFICQFNA